MSKFPLRHSTPRTIATPTLRRLRISAWDTDSMDNTSNPQQNPATSFNLVEVPPSAQSIPEDAETVLSAYGVNVNASQQPLSHGYENGDSITRPFQLHHPYHQTHASTSTFEPQSAPPVPDHEANHLEYLKKQAFLAACNLSEAESNNTHPLAFAAPMPQTHHNMMQMLVPNFNNNPFFNGEHFTDGKNASQLYPIFNSVHAPPVHQLPTPVPSNPATPPLFNALGLYISNTGDERNVPVSSSATGLTQGEGQGQHILHGLDPSIFPPVNAQLGHHRGGFFIPELKMFTNTNSMDQSPFPSSVPALYTKFKQTPSSSSSTSRESKPKEKKHRKPYRRSKNISVMTTAQPTASGSSTFASISEGQPAMPSFPGECLIPGCTAVVGDEDSAEAREMKTRAGFKSHLHGVHLLTRSKNSTRPTICPWPGCRVELQSGSAARHVMSIHGPKEKKASPAAPIASTNTEPAA